MRDDIKKLSQDIMTTQEVAEYLNLSKQMISVLVRNGKLPYLKELKNGYLFYKPHVATYKTNEPAHNANITINFSGSSHQTYDYAIEWCNKQASIEKIELYFWEFEALLDGYYYIKCDNLINLPQTVWLPNAVISSSNGSMLFLNGFNCGFVGTGPTTTAKFIENLTGLKSFDKIASSNQIVKLFKNQNEWSYFCPSSRFGKNYSIDSNRVDTLFEFKALNEKLVIAQKERNNFDLSPTDFLMLAKYFIPAPKNLYFFRTLKEAQENGYYLYNSNNFLAKSETIYRIIIIDQNGNQLWLKDFSESSESIGKNASLKELIEYTGFNLPIQTLSEEIRNWIKTQVFNYPPDSLFLSK
jgi:excisionase family DNA binding protein